MISVQRYLHSSTLSKQTVCRANQTLAAYSPPAAEFGSSFIKKSKQNFAAAKRTSKLVHNLAADKDKEKSFLHPFLLLHSDKHTRNPSPDISFRFTCVLAQQNIDCAWTLQKKQKVTEKPQGSLSLVNFATPSCKCLLKLAISLQQPTDPFSRCLLLLQRFQFPRTKPL